MALDIRRGDLVDDGSQQYTILLVDIWPRTRFGSAWATRLTLPVTTLRGINGAAYATLLTGLMALPPVPVQSEFQMDSPMDTARQVKQTFIKSPDDDQVYVLTLGDSQ